MVITYHHFMENSNTWSRRKFSRAILSLQALMATGSLAVPLGCIENKTDPKQKLFSPHIQRVLRLAMDEIIPRSDKMPAASEVGGIDYIASVLNEYPDLSEGFKEILKQLDKRGEMADEDGFTALNKRARITVLRLFEKQEPSSFSVLVNFVYESYYINEQVWPLIGYEPYPTNSAGPRMKPFDESSLERIKDIPPFYINTKNHG